MADTLSSLELTENEFSADAFAGDEEEFSNSFSLTHKEIAHHQRLEDNIQRLLQTNDKCQKVTYRHSDSTCDLVTRDKKVVVPTNLQARVLKWCHEHLMHTGETRLEFTIGQHFYWKGLRESCIAS